MHDKYFILHSFGQFFKYSPFRLIALFLITLFLGFTQGITIVLLIPLLGLLDPVSTSSSSNKLTDFLGEILSRNDLNPNLTVVLVLFALCLFLIAVLNYYQSLMQFSYQQEFSYQMRKRLYKKIITSEWSFLNGKSKHNHIQVLTSEIPKMTNYYYFYLGLATKIIFIVTHVILAAMISLKFTGFVVAIGILIFVVLRGYLKTATTLGAGNIQASRKMLKQIDDFWQTVKIAKVHNSEEFYYKKFEESNSLILDNQCKQIRNRAIPQLLFTLAGVISLIVIVYLAYSIIHIPLTSLFVLILLFARIFPQFKSTNSDMNMLVSCVESVKMVLELDREMIEREFDKISSCEKIEFNDRLEIKNLYFSYRPEHPIFTNFSESFPAKAMTGIIGKSGCGKTTLIDIIAGLLKIDGTIIVDGLKLTSEKLPAWRSEIGYLPQDSFFVDGTIRDNLIWDTESCPDDKLILDILRELNMDDIVLQKKNGLDTYIANYQYHFSGGERQRLALARVLIRKPKLLLLDEATSSLDTETEAQIMKSLVHLKENVTIVFVTHRHYLESYFDKIIDFRG